MELLPVTLLLCGLAVSQVSCGGGKDAGKLYDRLFKNYNPAVRPVTDVRNTLDVDFGLSLLEILDLSENGRMTISGWLKMRWKDAFLKWSPKEYSGVRQIHVPAKDLWLPDIVLFNSADFKADKERNLIVYSDGSVLWITPTIFTISCRHEFRGNAWVCPFRFGSWSYNGLQVELSAFGETSGIDTSEYLSEDSYALLENKGQKRERKYPCCEETYPAMEYMLKLRSKLGQALLLGRRR